MFDFSGIFGVERFKIWCQKVLPTVYDDSLSYMELLCKVLKVLEEYGKGSAEIAEQVVLLNEELEKVKEDIATLAENGGKTDEQVGANTDAIAALGERVGVVEQQVVSIAESLVKVRDDITALGETVEGKIGGKTAYLGEYVDMDDVRPDAVIVGCTGTEEEPYNVFKAGGSKAHGGWVRVGEEFVTESDFKKLVDVMHDITEEQAGNLKTFALGEVSHDFYSEWITSDEGNYVFASPSWSLDSGCYIITLYPWMAENIAYTGVLTIPNGYSGSGLTKCSLGDGVSCEYDGENNTLNFIAKTGVFGFDTSDVADIKFEIRRIY